MRGAEMVMNGASAMIGSAAKAQKFRFTAYNAAVAMITNANDPAPGLLQNAQHANTMPKANHQYSTKIPPTTNTNTA